MATGQNSATLYDSAGNAFWIDANGKIVINGAVNSFTSQVAALFISNGVLYQTAPDPTLGGASRGWWKYTPGTGWNNWTKVTDAPLVSSITASSYKPLSDILPSADGATAGAGGATLYDALFNAFSINAKGKIVVNGVVDNNTVGVTQLVVDDGHIYQSAPDPTTGGATAGWWEYTPGSGWQNWTKMSGAPDITTPSSGETTDTGNSTDTTDTTDTATPTSPAASADGTTVTKGSGTIYDADLNTYSISESGKVVINGVEDANTHNVTGLLFEDGHVYQTAPNPTTGGASAGWWQYTPGSGWNNWTSVSDPHTSTTSPSSAVTISKVVTTSSSGSSSSTSSKFPEHWSRLDNGINIERSEISKISDAELKKLAASGVENIRIFMSPDDGYLTVGKAMNPESSSYVKFFADFMHRVNDAGMAVIISPFGGVTRGAWQKDPSDQASINQYVSWYKEFASYIANHFSYKDVFIESQTEPFMSDPSAWWKIEDQFIKAVHSVAPDFTFISSSNGKVGSQWTYIDSLVSLTPHSDTNVVYNIHDYVPMNFTHQGQTWMGDYWGSLKNVQYTAADAAQTAKDFATLAAWAEKYGVMITVNEFGASQTASESERAEFFADVRANAEKYGFGWDVWDFNKGFSISTTDSAGDEVVKDVYQKALTWGAYQDTPNTSNTVVVTTVTGTMDAAHAVSEKIAFDASELGKLLVVKNFDAVAGTDNVQDSIDLSAIFNSLGGKYSDGVNDAADRAAALTFTTGDFDGDGKANDLKIGIAGVSSFSLTLIAPVTTDSHEYTIGDVSQIHDNIWIA